MQRYLHKQIVKDLNEKMVFLGGPRQVGKTTLSQQVAKGAGYLNWDDGEDREKILKVNLPNTKVWIFDEIHKYKSWRNYIKGLYDKNKSTHKFIVTGSARLDFYRRGGDSLQGRYHYLRLYPLTLDELKTEKQNDFAQLFNLGGFPEPFLGGKKIDAQRWSRQYRQRLIQEDILSIESIEDVGKAELLMLRLPELVSAPLSANALREDLQISHKTVQRWLEIFEAFYAIFRITAFGSPLIKAVKKERKHYHFDWTLVKSEGPRFENMIALHLLKICHYYQDTQGREIHLHFYADIEQREVDFVIAEDKQPIAFVECKFSHAETHKGLSYLKAKFPKTAAYQMSFDSKKDFFDAAKGIRVGPAVKLLPELFELLK